jgi:hypothetical protein
MFYGAIFDAEFTAFAAVFLYNDLIIIAAGSLGFSSHGEVDYI